MRTCCKGLAADSVRNYGKSSLALDEIATDIEVIALNGNPNSRMFI